MFRPVKVTFTLDGTGVYYDPAEPIMLDSLLSACLCRFHVHGEPPTRDEEPIDIPLPLKRWEKNGTWGWYASALFPDGETRESLQFWRRRMRQNRIELAAGSPNTTNGPYRDWNSPIPLILCQKMVAYAFGEASKIRMNLRRSIKNLGKKRAYGRGAVTDIEVIEIEEDYSITKDNVFMRYWPDEHGCVDIRPRPPYWSKHGRVPCMVPENGFIGNEV